MCVFFGGEITQGVPQKEAQLTASLAPLALGERHAKYPSAIQCF